MVVIVRELRLIGQLARECGLSVGALRFYDTAGVLVPAWVDPRTGYRFYADDQLLDARLVARLRRVRMAPAEIARVLAHRRDRERVDTMLAEHLRRLEDGLTDARRELRTVRALLDQETTMTTCTTDATHLADAVRAVRYAVSTDPELPMLHGVLLEIDDAGLALAATDRFRLATATVVADSVHGDPVDVVVPVKFVDRLLAVAADGQVDVTVDATTITVRTDGGAVVGECLPHEFPDYRSLLGRANDRGVELTVDAFRDVLEAAESRSVDGEDGRRHEAAVLTVGRDGGLDEAGGGPEIGVNREFLLQTLDAAAGDQLVLDLDGPLRPLVIRDPARADTVAMLMPIRLE